MLSRGIKLVGALATPLFVMGGCVMQPVTGMSIEQPQTQFFSVLEQTEVLIGGEWDNRDDPTPRGCVIALGIEGESFPALRFGEPPRQVDSTLAAIAVAWTDFGYTVDMVDIGPVVQLSGTRGADELVVVRASDLAITLQGESECRPAS